MKRFPGDITKRRDEATGLQLAAAACQYLHQVPHEDGFTAITGLPLAVAADADRRRALVFTSAADNAAGDAALACTIKAVVEELDEVGIPHGRVLVTGHLRWSPKGEFPREFGEELDQWLQETAPDRVQDLKEAFEQEFRDKGN